MQLFELAEGKLFAFDYDRNRVFRLVSHGEADEKEYRCEVRQVAGFWPNENEWKLYPNSPHENANPYCGIVLVNKVSTVTTVEFA